MELYRFPPIYRAVIFYANDKRYYLRPANNTVVGPQLSLFTVRHITGDMNLTRQEFTELVSTPSKISN